MVFVYEHRALFNCETVISTSLTYLVGNKMIFWTGLSLLLVTLFKVLVEAAGKKTDWGLIYWIIGVLLLVILINPIFQQERISDRLEEASVVLKPSMTIGQLFGLLGHRFLMSVTTLFYGGWERYDLRIGGEGTYFDIVSLIFIIPGLVYALVRPTRIKMFLLVGALVGLGPHMLADPGGNRLVGCIVPLLLLGTLGCDQIIETACSFSKSYVLRIAMVVLWVGLFAAGGFIVFQKTYRYFYNWVDSEEVVWAKQIMKDSPQNRVYLAGWVDFGINILNEQEKVYLLNGNSNPIFLAPLENPPNVIILLREKVEESNNPLFMKIKSQFPGAQQEERSYKVGMDKPPFNMVRFIIPGTQLSENSAKLIHLVRVSDHSWTRKFYLTAGRMGTGIILLEDCVNSLANPLPREILTGKVNGFNSPWLSGRMEYHFEAPTEGKYIFSFETGNFLDVWMDNQRVSRVRPTDAKSIKSQSEIYLKMGRHELRLMGGVNEGDNLGPIKMKVLYPLLNEWKPLS
jgi:hypothetical protein